MEFYQQVIKLIADRVENPGDFLKGSQRSAFTMEDLPSDCYGVDFGRELWGRFGNAKLDAIPHREMMEQFFSKCGAVYPTGKNKCEMMNETTPGSCTLDRDTEHWAPGEPYRYTSVAPYLLKSAKPLCPSPSAIPCSNASVVTTKAEGPGETQLPKTQVDISTGRGTAAITIFENLKLSDAPLTTKGRTVFGINKRGGFFGGTTLKNVPDLGETSVTVEGNLPAGRIHARAEAGSIISIDATAMVKIDFPRLFKGLLGPEMGQAESVFKSIIASKDFKQLLVGFATHQIGAGEFADGAKKLFETAKDQLSRQFPQGIGGIVDTVIDRLRDEVALATSIDARGTLSVFDIPTTAFFAHKGTGLTPLLGAEVGVLPSELSMNRRVVVGAKGWLYGEKILQAQLAAGFDPFANKFVLGFHAENESLTGYKLYLNVRGGLALDGNGEIVGAVGVKF
jgi:hypothetical protein